MQEKHFPRPAEFLPERWLDASPSPEYTSLPFGSGARACIGRRLAETALIVLLVRVECQTIQRKFLFSFSIPNT